MLDKFDLLAQCADLGLEPGDLLMPHVSLRALGPVAGGADTLIAALGETVAPDGALLARVACKRPFDEIGRGTYTAEEEVFLRAHCPPFDPQRARARRSFGAFAEVFRRRPGAVCSDNPGARIAALGDRAAVLTRGHPLDRGFGPDSPYARLCAGGGKVLLVGADPDHVSLLHHAEEMAPIADKRTLRLAAPVRVDGARRWIAYGSIDTRRGIRPWPERFFADIVDAFVREVGAVRGRLGRAETTVLEARALVDFAVPFMVAEAARSDSAPPPG